MRSIQLPLGFEKFSQEELEKAIETFYEKLEDLELKSSVLDGIIMKQIEELDALSSKISLVSHVPLKQRLVYQHEKLAAEKNENYLKIQNVKSDIATVLCCIDELTIALNKFTEAALESVEDEDWR
ncbi:MAG: hypothetical protein C4292_00950 [Nitrososphaera sp.]